MDNLLSLSACKVLQQHVFLGDTTIVLLRSKYIESSLSTGMLTVDEQRLPELALRFIAFRDVVVPFKGWGVAIAGLALYMLKALT